MQKLKRGTYIRDKDDSGSPLFGYVWRCYADINGKWIVEYRPDGSTSGQRWKDIHANQKLFSVYLSNVEVAERQDKAICNYYDAITGE